MTNQEPKQTVNNLVDQGKSLIAKGNTRHLVIRSKDGDKLADISLTIGVLIGAFVLFTPVGIPLAIVAILLGIWARLRVELVHDLSESDDVVQVDLTEE